MHFKYEKNIVGLHKGPYPQLSIDTHLSSLLRPKALGWSPWFLRETRIFSKSEIAEYCLRHYFTVLP